MYFAKLLKIRVIKNLNQPCDVSELTNPVGGDYLTSFSRGLSR